MVPSWLTTDEAIRKMLSDLIPLVALGNITMSLGMATWALIGSQGRYYLSTTISLMTSFLITIPLGAVMTLWLNIDLQGLTFSISKCQRKCVVSLAHYSNSSSVLKRMIETIQSLATQQRPRCFLQFSSYQIGNNSQKRSLPKSPLKKNPRKTRTAMTRRRLHHAHQAKGQY